MGGTHRSKNDLAKQLAELKNELLSLRVQKIAGGSASKLTKMCVNLYPTIRGKRC
jgi:large subunit ribosomal protein L35e